MESEQGAGVAELAVWWARAREQLQERGVPCFRGDVAGESPILGLELADASEGFRALLDVLVPGYCVWDAEDNDDNEPCNCRPGLLSRDSWHILEVGTPVDDHDEDLNESDVDDSVDDSVDDLPQHQPRVEAITAEVADALVAELDVSTPILRDLGHRAG